MSEVLDVLEGLGALVHHDAHTVRQAVVRTPNIPAGVDDVYLRLDLRISCRGRDDAGAGREELPYVG